MKKFFILLGCLLGLQLQAQSVVELNGQRTIRDYDGLGVLVSYGKLLYDYPTPQRDQIMDYLFRPNYGANLQILKVELGYDGNNTAMSWPSHRRTLEEENNFERGFSWWYMKEAKKRNPEIILSALHWGYPAWAVTDEQKADFVVDYVEGAYKVHGLRIDYIGGNQNESTITPEVTKLIRRKLDKKGFSDVQIIAADEGARVKEFKVLDMLANDPAYADAVDVIGVHYKSRPASFMPPKAHTLGKRLWSSEDGGGGYTTASQGGGWIRQLMKLLLDVRMTGVVRWLATASIYDNMPWPRNGIMRTKEPWSGHYQIGANLWAFAHFTQFIKPGWRLMESGTSYLVPADSAGRFIAYCNPKNGDYSIVVDAQDKRLPAEGVDFRFKVQGGLSGAPVKVWRSFFTEDGERLVQLESVKADQTGVICVHLDKNYVYTLSTTTGQGKGDAVSPAAHPFPLPLKEDFESYPAGRMARYFVDANSTFETAPAGGGRQGTVLRQVILDKPQLWHPGSRHVAQPVTEVGGMEWTDYTAQVDVLLETPGRVVLGCRIDPETESSEKYQLEGLWMILGNDGAWEIRSKRKETYEVKASGRVNFGLNQWTTLSLEMQGDQVRASIGGEQVAAFRDSSQKAGNVLLGTLAPEAADFHDPTDRYTLAQFDNLNIY